MMNFMAFHRIPVFYQLAEGNGNPYNKLPQYVESIAAGSTILQFCETIVAARKDVVKVGAMQLEVFASRYDLFCHRPLDMGFVFLNLRSIASCDPLYVTVPPIHSQLPRSIEHDGSSVHKAERIERWDRLKVILESNKRARNSVADTVTDNKWAQVQDVYKPISTKLQLTPWRGVNVTVVQSLMEYLNKAGVTLEHKFGSNNIMRLHLITPVLIHVNSLFPYGTTVKVHVNDTAVDSENVKWEGSFDFILQHKTKSIYVLQGNDELSVAQALVGCEAVADVERLSCVYAIVTNFTQWTFLKSFDDRIERCQATLEILQNQIPTHDSLSTILGMIYALLSEE